MDVLRVDLYGVVDHEIWRSVKALDFGDRVNVMSYVPHGEAVRRMTTSRVLLLPVNRSHNALGVVPGKLLEYLGARRPVLLIGPPDGDAARIVCETGSGQIIDFDDSAGVANALKAWFAPTAREARAWTHTASTAILGALWPGNMPGCSIPW